MTDDFMTGGEMDEMTDKIVTGDDGWWTEIVGEGGAGPRSGIGMRMTDLGRFVRAVKGRPLVHVRWVRAVMLADPLPLASGRATGKYAYLELYGRPCGRGVPQGTHPTLETLKRPWMRLPIRVVWIEVAAKRTHWLRPVDVKSRRIAQSSRARHSRAAVIETAAPLGCSDWNTRPPMSQQCERSGHVAFF